MTNDTPSLVVDRNSGIAGCKRYCLYVSLIALVSACSQTPKEAYPVTYGRDLGQEVTSIVGRNVSSPPLPSSTTPETSLEPTVVSPSPTVVSPSPDIAAPSPPVTPPDPEVALLSPLRSSPATPTPEDALKTLIPKRRIMPDIEIAKLSRHDLDEQLKRREVGAMCARIARKLASVAYTDCMELSLMPAEIRSVEGNPLISKRYYSRGDAKALGRVLILGGTHGDELTSVSVVFKWMWKLQDQHSHMFEWLVAPVVNPDGVLRGQAIRTNARGIDLNRNFPTPGWSKLSLMYWVSTGKDPRRFPGFSAGSEPETKWVAHLIERFRPDVIVTVHAPLDLVDFDAPDRSFSPLQLGILKKNLKGTYPGSLGNYAGIQRGIPVLTLELPHSWIMPKERIVSGLWIDTVQWLRSNMDKAQAQRAQLIPVLAKRSQ